MYYLQVIESARYATLAEENRINLRLLAPPRGRIVDRFGVPMAVNQQNYRVLLISEATDDVDETLELLGAIIPIGDGDKRRILREIRRRRGFVPVTVRENLNWEEVARIEVNTPDLPGVMIDVSQSRHYPDGEDTAHVLGYVAAVSEAELGGDPLLELPGFRIGKAGIEKVYDLALRGTGGSSQVEVNALGRVIREMRRQEGQPGAEVTLTIDLELQRMVVRRLAGESASIVVMDVHTGDVLAMASTPSFDPNAFNKGLSAEAWRGLVANPKAPLTNKAIRGQYAPGSTFKIVVALAALNKGAITPETTFFCPGFLRLGNAKFHCWKRGGHGTVDLATGITQSCDVYFYETALRTGIDRIAAMARRLGFGRRLGLDLPGEQPGLGADQRLEARHHGRAVAEGRDPDHRDRPGVSPGHAAAAGGDDGAPGQRRLRGDAPSDPEHGGRRRHHAQPPPGKPGRRGAIPEDGARGDDGGGQQPPRDGVQGAHQGGRLRDGGQDRHRPGAAHHQGRARHRRAQEQGPAVGRTGTTRSSSATRRCTRRATRWRCWSNTAAAARRRRRPSPATSCSRPSAGTTRRARPTPGA